MKYKISESTSTPLMEVYLNAGENLKIETGSFVYKSNGVTLEGKTNGGFFKAVSKSLVGRENFFITYARSNQNNQIIAIAPKSIGEIRLLDTNEGQWYLTDGAFLASEETVDYDVVRQKNLTQSLLGGTGGFFILKTKGQGKIAINSFGSMQTIELDGTNPLTIDSGHVVAWEETLAYSVNVASGVIGFKSGEGLVNTFTGKGRVIIQTRNLKAFVDIILPFIPQQR